MTTDTILEKVKIQIGQMHIEKVVNEKDGTTSDDIVFDELEENPILIDRIKDNTKMLLRRVKVPKYYSNEQIQEVIEQYADVIAELTLYDYYKRGGDYQKSHSENGISRSWVSKEEILAYNGVMTYANVAKK